MDKDNGFRAPEIDLVPEQENDATHTVIVKSDELDTDGVALRPQSQTSAFDTNSSSSNPELQVIAEKYEILEKLGSGGLSSVFRVKHLHLDKIYALKLLHELKEESVLRFQQEAKAASLLQHPNIVGIVDFGVFGGKPYMVMNCVEGETLSQYAKKNRPLNPHKGARIFGQIAGALAHAHEKGVVHRDIKPSNIMISFDENQVEQAIVVDFGIAKITSAKPGDFNSQLTRTGDIFGTPLYMSPEQCKGLPVDARSDIYSLGCVMYEVITGEPPFPGDSPYEIIHKQISEAPIPFSAELRRLPIVAKMEALILKSMAKSASDRFEYMLEMSSAIKAIELGARGSKFSLTSWTLAMARLRASDKQQTVLKLGIGISSLLSLLFALVIAFFPTEIDRLSKRIDTENKIIARTMDIFSFRYDKNASLYRIKRSEIKIKLAEIRVLAKFDKEIGKRFDEIAKMTILSADKIHDLRGMKRAITSDAPTGTLSHLSTLKERIESIEFLLGEASNFWAEANLKSVDLTNSISKQVELEERQKSIMSTVLTASRILIFPVIGLLLFSVYMMIASKRKSWVASASIDAKENGAA